MQAMQNLVDTNLEDPSPNMHHSSQNQQASHCNEGNNDTCAKGNPLMDKESILQA